MVCNSFKTCYIVFVNRGELVFYKKLLGIYLYNRYEPPFCFQDKFNGEFSNYKNVILLVEDLQQVVALDREIQSL